MDAFTTMDDIVFDTLGAVAQIQRRPDPAVAITLIVRDGVERLGEFQQVVGRARHVVVRSRDWRFRRGDEVTLDGSTQAVEALVRDDGLVNEAVLHG
ncbi:MAG: head-tail joining protein [Lysobacter sp.]